MTPEEIVKALNICKHRSGCFENGDTCPYYYTHKPTNCMEDMMDDVIHQLSDKDNQISALTARAEGAEVLIEQIEQEAKIAIGHDMRMYLEWILKMIDDWRGARKEGEK